MCEKCQETATNVNVNNLRALVKALNEANTLLMEASNDSVPGCVHRYQDLLSPWSSVLEPKMHQPMDWVFSNIKKIYSYDCTRADLVESVNSLITHIEKYAAEVLIEQCTQSITEAFAHVDDPAAAIALATAIDETKNACLARFFNNHK